MIESDPSSRYHSCRVELVGCMGRHGFSEVWAAHHPDYLIPLIVKIWRAPWSDQIEAKLWSQLQRVASISDQHGLHPILDMGRVREHPDLSKTLDDAAVFYVISERALGGSLTGLLGHLPTRVVGRVASELLRALSALHARGIVHGHLKPSNVLLLTQHARESLKAEGHVPGTICLSDAGQPNALVSLTDSPAPQRWIQDASLFVAPEQRVVEPTRWTPATDLFAVGALTHALLTGVLPYDTAPGLQGPVIELDSTLAGRADVSEDMRAWLRSMLSILPHARPPSAYAARKDLDACWEMSDPVRPESGSFLLAHALRSADMRRSLHGLKQPMLAGRGDDFKALEATLQHCIDTRVPTLLILDAPRGHGSRALAQAFCQRLESDDRAMVLRTPHDPNHDGGFGLRQVLASQLEPHLRHHLALDPTRALFHPEHRHQHPLINDLHSLTQRWLQPDPNGEIANVPHVMERRAMITRILTLLGRFGQVVLWLDHAEWGSEALEVTRHLLNEDYPHAAPPLILMCADRETLDAPSSRVAARRIARLRRHKYTREHTLTTLGEIDRQTLAQNFIPLNIVTAQHWAALNFKHPLMQVHYLDERVFQADLTYTSSGFSGELPPAPTSMAPLWQSRLRALLENTTPFSAGAVQTALERAATLGLIVHTDEWRRVCDDLHGVSFARLIAALVHARLAQRTAEGWRWQHSALRDHVLANAKQPLTSHHQRCADALASAAQGSFAEIALRRGVHLFHARRFKVAFPLLLDAARGYLKAGDHLGAKRPIDLLSAALEQKTSALGVDQHVAFALVAAQSRMERGQLGKARALIERGLATLPKTRSRLRADTLKQLADVAMEEGRLVDSQRFYETTLDIYATLGATYACAETLKGLGVVARRRGDLAGSRTFLERALESLDDNHPWLQGECYRNISVVHAFLGDTDKAKACIEAALVRFRRIDHRRQLASCHNVLGELARKRGQLSAAAREYQRALKLYADVGIDNKDVAIVKVNLGLVWLRRGQVELAWPFFTDPLRTFTDMENWGFVAAMHVTCLACLADDPAESLWKHHLSEAVRLLDETQWSNPDTAWPLEMAAERASKANQHARARAVLELAARQWQRLGMTDKYVDVQRRLRAL